MPGLGLPTGRITSGTTPKMPAYATPRMPSGQVAGVGIPRGAKLIAQGSGMGSGQVPVSDPFGATGLPVGRPPHAPASSGYGGTNPDQAFVAPGDGIGSAMRYDAATGYQGNDHSHPVNFATGAGMGFQPTGVHGVYEKGGNSFTNVPSVYNEANQISPSDAAEQLASSIRNQGANLSPSQQNAIFGGTGVSYSNPAPAKSPASVAQTSLKPPVRNPLAGAAINKAYEPDPFNGAAIQTQYEPVAQQAGNFIGSSIGDAWGAGPGVPTAPDAPTFTPSKWAGTHAVEDAYNSGLGQYGVKGISDYWTAKGLPSARPIPAIYDPSDWWIAKQLGSFGRGLAGS